MKTHNILFIILAMGITFSVNAQGEQKCFRKAGRFGLGAQPILGFTRTVDHNDNKSTSLTAGLMATSIYNISGRNVVTANFGIQQIISHQYFTDGESETKANERLFQLGYFRSILLLANNKTQLDVQLGLIGLFSKGSDTYVYTNTLTNAKQESEGDIGSLQISPSIRPEWFVNENLSFHTQVGIVFSILDEDNGGFSEGGVHINIFGAADLLGNAGFTFYF